MQLSPSPILQLFSLPQEQEKSLWTLIQYRVLFGCPNVARKHQHPIGHIQRFQAMKIYKINQRVRTISLSPFSLFFQKEKEEKKNYFDLLNLFSSFFFFFFLHPPSHPPFFLTPHKNH